jgi:hypothetical protein
MTNNWAYALSGGEAGRTPVAPERAEYIRVILSELTRLINHTCPGRIPVAGYGRAGDAADVRLPRTRKNTRSCLSP